MSTNLLQQSEGEGFFVNQHGYWFFLKVNRFDLPIMKPNDETEEKFLHHMEVECGIDMCEYGVESVEQLREYMMEYAIYVDADQIYDSRGFGEPYDSVNDILEFQV